MSLGKYSFKNFYKNRIGLGSLLLIGMLIIFYLSYTYYISVRSSVKVGILFSKTGMTAESEQPIINAALLAIDQINASGGVNGKKIIPVIYNPNSEWSNYAKLAERMILVDGVKAIFGCYTSAARKEVKPIVEKYNNLLIYPVSYEGIEESNNIIYLGATPNQKMIPAINWLMIKGYQKFFIIGSRSIDSYISNEMLAHEINIMGGQLLGIINLPLLSNNQMNGSVREILSKRPDVILNTLYGNSNIVFFNTLYNMSKETNSLRPPVMSFLLNTADMTKISANKIAGDYSVWSYFKAQDTLENKIFLNAYQDRYRSIDEVNDPAMTIYSGVFLWAQGVSVSDSFEPQEVRQAMLNQSFASPAGVIYIDPKNANAWRMILIGKINKKGKFDILWNSGNPIEPIVYPDFKTKTEWDLLEYQMYLRWDKTWENF